MFKNIYPLFESKSLLKKEMLENLRDYPRSIIQIFCQDYSDGIITGCELSVLNHEIIISPGILCFKGVLYILEKLWKVEYRPTGKVTFLKVKFFDKIVENGQEVYLSRVYLDETIPNASCEIELARFKLQHGSRLRVRYTDFSDFNTEFDTLNRIYVPFASLRKHSLYPQILRVFSNELLRYPIQNPWDYAFILNCVKLHTAMPYDEIQSYLNIRLENKQKEYSNIAVYNALNDILIEAKGEKAIDRRTEKGDRKLLLI